MPDEIERVVRAAASRDEAIVEFVDALRSAVAAGYTVREIATAARISPSYVSRLVSGERGARPGRDSEGTA